MICSVCDSVVPAGRAKCPRCGGKPVAAKPSVAEELLKRPWLIGLLAASAFATLWIATRPAPPPVVIAPAIERTPEPTAAPTPEPEYTPPPMPAFPPPEPAAAAEAEPVLVRTKDEPLVVRPDGTWNGGPALKRPGER